MALLRTCRSLVFEKLDNVMTLDSDDLLKAFADIVDGHFSLSHSGIKSCDVSTLNMMWNPCTKVGVLNDYDTARTDGEEHARSKNPRLERTSTGTNPFLALDLLAIANTDSFPHGRVVPNYTHGCDSLKWVFLYLCSVVPGSAVLKWLTTDPQRSLEIRHLYLVDPSLFGFKIGARHEKLAQNALAVLGTLCKVYLVQLARSHALEMEEDPGEHVEAATDVELFDALKSIIRPL
ncbi:hypothetical protein FIBSPDRAFT_938994 [Athelia psychrophila]|uniref:Fungal-type protein kinase domain-containing protein n=1 Tax=Athelia psychrophila TaxID=1759441 RepID=A0A165XDQ0_9AGAM|nr:hypothetical protein FIBSPDRAFT_938994 [Fibularhizoctonia sp. CBS 109695]